MRKAIFIVSLMLMLPIVFAEDPASLNSGGIYSDDIYQKPIEWKGIELSKLDWDKVTKENIGTPPWGDLVKQDGNLPNTGVAKDSFEKYVKDQKKLESFKINSDAKITSKGGVIYNGEVPLPKDLPSKVSVEALKEGGFKVGGVTLDNSIKNTPLKDIQLNKEGSLSANIDGRKAVLPEGSTISRSNPELKGKDFVKITNPTKDFQVDNFKMKAGDSYLKGTSQNGLSQDTIIGDFSYKDPKKTVSTSGTAITHVATKNGLLQSMDYLQEEKSNVNVNGYTISKKPTAQGEYAKVSFLKEGGGPMPKADIHIWEDQGTRLQANGEVSIQSPKNTWSWQGNQGDKFFATENANERRFAYQKQIDSKLAGMGGSLVVDGNKFGFEQKDGKVGFFQLPDRKGLNPFTKATQVSTYSTPGWTNPVTEKYTMDEGKTTVKGADVKGLLGTLSAGWDSALETAKAKVNEYLGEGSGKTSTSTRSKATASIKEDNQPVDESKGYQYENNEPDETSITKQDQAKNLAIATKEFSANKNQNRENAEAKVKQDFDSYIQTQKDLLESEDITQSEYDKSVKKVGDMYKSLTGKEYEQTSPASRIVTDEPELSSKGDATVPVITPPPITQSALQKIPSIDEELKSASSSTGQVDWNSLPPQARQTVLGSADNYEMSGKNIRDRVNAFRQQINEGTADPSLVNLYNNFESTYGKKTLENWAKQNLDIGMGLGSFPFTVSAAGSNIVIANNPPTFGQGKVFAVSAKYKPLINRFFKN